MRPLFRCGRGLDEEVTSGVFRHRVIFIDGTDGRSEQNATMEKSSESVVQFPGAEPGETGAPAGTP
jgi:hypothetical protein